MKRFVLHRPSHAPLCAACQHVTLCWAMQDTAANRVNIHLATGDRLRAALDFTPLSLPVSLLLAALYAGLPAKAARPLHAAMLPFIGESTVAG